MLKPRSLLSLFLILLCSVAYAQQNRSDEISVNGKITDTKGNGILYASVYVEETKSAYATNEKGEFTVTLIPGKYTFHIMHINYETYSRLIEIDADKTIMIKLTPKSFILKEVEVQAGKEDPAYAVMRKAVSRAPIHRKQLESFKANVYTKATLHVEHIPKILKKALENDKSFPIKEGSIFTRESISEIDLSDDSLKQRIISVNSSFTEIINTGDLDRFSLYNIYSHTGDFISPLSSRALSVYRFRLESISSHSDGRKIYHIRVIPKNNNRYAFSGYVDIMDSTWHVHYFDLSAEMNMGIANVEINLKQNFGELEKNIWMPITYYLTEKIKTMGLHATVRLSASIRYMHYIRQKTAQKTRPFPENSPEPEISAKSKKIDEQLKELTSKEDLKNRDVMKMVSLLEAKAREEEKNNPQKKAKSLEIKDSYFYSVDSLAYNRDTSYWMENRRIPLTEEEQRSYEIKKNDSTENRGKEQTIFESRKKNVFYGLNDIHEIVGFHPVNGYTMKLGAHINWMLPDSTLWKNSLMAGYAFARKTFLFSAVTRYDYYPEKNGWISLSGGADATDYNYRGGIDPGINTLSTLFFKINNIFLYDRRYVEIEHHIEPFNGFDTRFSFSYEWRKSLDNRTQYSFFYRNTREYLPNIPDNEYLNANRGFLENGEAALFQLELNYTPRRYYTYSGRKKIYFPSRYPTFTFLWKKGIPGIGKSKTNFDYVEISVSHKIRPTILRSFHYHIAAGWFPHNSSMHFSEFRHFSLSGFPMTMKRLFPTYHTLEVYRPSTNEWMLSGFFKYETQYLLLKYIPFLNKSLMTESLYFSYLKTPHIKDFMEIGYSFNNIFLFLDLGVFVGFENFKFHAWGVRAALTLPSL